MLEWLGDHQSVQVLGPLDRLTAEKDEKARTSPKAEISQLRNECL